jgi:hypothetical protein
MKDEFLENGQKDSEFTPNDFRNYCTCGNWFLTKDFLKMHINYMNWKGEEGHECKI